VCSKSDAEKPSECEKVKKKQDPQSGTLSEKQNINQCWGLRQWHI